MKYGPFDKAETYQTDYYPCASEALREMAEWLEDKNDDPTLLCINIGMDDSANFFGTMTVEQNK